MRYTEVIRGVVLDLAVSKPNGQTLIGQTAEQSNTGPLGPNGMPSRALIRLATHPFGPHRSTAQRKLKTHHHFASSFFADPPQINFRLF
jgi:hypothetical protein